MGKILVTGATGNVGRIVVDELLRRGATGVRALTNDPAKAALPDGVEVVEGFIGRLASLPAALEGVDVMYLAPHPRTAKEVLAMARDAGVRRIVDLSASEADEEAKQDPSQWHYYAMEYATENSGLPWTHLRPGEFMDNRLEWADKIKAGDLVRAPAGAARNAPIHLRDIASVAAEVLLSEDHLGQKYVLTGPESLTRHEMLAAIGKALGRDLRWEEQPRDEAIAELAAAGMGEWAEWYVDGQRSMADQPQEITTWVEQLTGDPGTTLYQWAVENAAQFR